MKKISVYLTDQQHKELKLFCVQKGVSMSFFANNAIKMTIQKELREYKKTSK